MATVNKRVRNPQAAVINGIDAGGLMNASIIQGYDTELSSSPDGLGGPALRDYEAEVTRGSLVTQDLVHLVDLATGTVSTKVFYTRKSGVGPDTGYVKNTIVNPVIHRIALTVTKKQYATIGVNFECKAEDETKGMADEWTKTDEQAAPAYVSAIRGGYRIKSAVFTPDDDSISDINIYHMQALSLLIDLMLHATYDDGDVGFTCVDVDEEGGTYNGSITFQDAGIASLQSTAQQVIAAGRGTLAVTLAMSGGATDKVLTIAGVDPKQYTEDNQPGKFSEYTLNFDLSNSTDTPLSLDGTNKLITIEDAS